MDDGGLLSNPNKDDDVVAAPLVEVAVEVDTAAGKVGGLASALPNASSPKCASKAAKPEVAFEAEALAPALPPNAESTASKDAAPNGSFPNVAEELRPSKASNFASNASVAENAFAEFPLGEKGSSSAVEAATGKGGADLAFSLVDDEKAPRPPNRSSLKADVFAADCVASFTSELNPKGSNASFVAKAPEGAMDGAADGAGGPPKGSEAAPKASPCKEAGVVAPVPRADPANEPDSLLGGGM